MPQDETMRNDSTFNIFNLNGIFLPSEQIKFSGKTTDGYILLSNYRLILKNKKILHHIPLGVIETAECRDIYQLLLLCKDTKSFKCAFLSNEACLEWQRRILQSITFTGPLQEIFAYKFFMVTSERGRDVHSDLLNAHENYSDDRVNQLFDDEVRRMGFDFELAWKSTDINGDYKFCPTYPKKLIVPSSITDKVLETVAKFRMSRRIPAVVWRHSNGAVIARSSQPEVGWLGWRSAEDEELLKSISKACALDSPKSTSCTAYAPCFDNDPPIHNLEDNENEGNLNINSKSLPIANCDIPSLSDFAEASIENDVKKILVVDARSYATAVANRARGGGCECPEYYVCEIQFMNLANIHAVRKSQQALRQLLTLSPDIPNWLSLLENTRWMNHISGLIKAALTVAQAIAIEGRPVLVHCSDGWDRTPQITALSQLILDPYYRTFQGFEVLIEKEWIEYGHKFSDRHGCGLANEDTNERSPVFLQWLDCVYQLLCQFPTAFQFNQAYLVKLVQHLYSNLFGTFLFNSSHQRLKMESRSKSYSLWSFFQLNTQHYINFLYLQTNEVLYPSFHLKDLELWKSVYLSEIDTDSHCFASQPSCSEEFGTASRSSELGKTKSCDDLTALCTTTNPCMIRRSSDPNIRESCFNAFDLKDEKEIFENQVIQTCNLPPPCTNDPIEEESKKFGTNVRCRSGSERCQTSNLNYPSRTECGEGTILSTSVMKCKNGIPHDLMFSEIIKRSIEGSTDTLVADHAAICDELRCSIDVESKSSTASSCSSEAKLIEKSSETKNNELHDVFSAKRSTHKNLITSFYSYSDDRITDKKALKSKPTSFQVYCSICNNNSKQVFDEVISLDCPNKTCHFQDTAKIFAEMEPNKLLSNDMGKLSSYASSGHSCNSVCITSGANEERFIELNSDICSNNFSPVDGLSIFKDECSKRLHQILLHYQTYQETLRRDLQASKSLTQQLINKLRLFNLDPTCEDGGSLPESLGSSSAEGSVGQDSNVSDASWEAVEESGLDPTLWVPDHAVDHCMGCNLQFWIGRRKHHCRNCGKIFCAQCSNNCAPIPRENLFSPVRVCGTCFMSLFDPHKAGFLTNQK